MKTKILTFLILLLSVSMWAQMTIRVDSLTLNASQIGTNVNVPVVVEVGALSIGSMQFEVVYDPAVLTPVTQSANNVGVVNSCAQIPISQWYSGAGSGYSVSPNWYDPTFAGISLSNGTTLFELQFTYLGGNSTLSFNTTNSLAYDANFTQIPITFINGGVIAAPVAPIVITGFADSINAVSASLTAQVNANNDSTTVWFKYGTSSVYTDSVPAIPSLVLGFGLTDVYAYVANLTPGTAYHFAVFAENSMGSVSGQDVVFTTVPSQPPYAETLLPNTIAAYSATLSGNVSANNAATVAFFEYGTDTTYGFVDTIPQSPFYGQDTIAVSLEITGLVPNTEYHFRVGATNQEGTVFGNDVSFTTNSALAYAMNYPAENITLSSALLKGRVCANNSSTAIKFVYGENGNFTDTTSAVPASAIGMDTIWVNATLNGLTGNSSYSFKVIAENSAGLTESQLLSFSTMVSTAPVATTLAATGVSSTDALLNGSINPGNASTSITYEYGTDTNYGQTVNAVPGTLNGSQTSPVMAQLSGLATNTTYHFRVVATNSEGTSQGDDLTFTTWAENEMAIRISSVTAPSNIGDTVTVPVIIEVGYDGILAMQFRFTFDPSVLTPIEISATNFGIVNPASETLANGGDWISGMGSGNEVSPNWFDPTFAGIHLLSGSQLFELQFIYHGGNSAIAVDVASCFVYNANNDELNVTYLSGSVGVPAPAVITLPATDIALQSATLQGTVNSFGSDANVWFQYGLNTNYGDSILASPSMVNNNIDVPVIAILSNLDELVTYHFRLVAESMNGINYGQDQSFMTVSVDEIHNDNLPQIYSYDSRLFVKFPKPIFEKAILQIFDLSGRLITTEMLINDTDFEYGFNVSPGIYLISIISQSNRYTKKISFR
ncbi:MAG: T9SS type A sorting domain-containing protein [Bacteroidales bacterium]|nr:T9SS type A sorting domain-containing protein [Bacteroidales bacterium]MCF8455736.1 T9SS type A sorting domain-containing protein [Bacteroidales bacterium]